MDSIFAELKKARESKHLTLSDISDSTLINLDFLQAIEQGNTAILPQTYVRAFIREYASVVGLDPNEMMQRYDEATKEGTGSSQTKVEPKEAKPTTATMSDGDRKSDLSLSKFSKPAIVSLIILIFGIVLWNLLRKEEPPLTEEPPFQNVVKQKVQEPTSLEREVIVEPQQRTISTTIDSLTLTANTTDSVWIQLAIDNMELQEYLFGPNERSSWNARKKFLLTIGNAGAIKFTLNGTSIGPLGKTGAVLRNVEFTRESLRKD
ncbi:MAG: DUF4115 domain-containing protein [Ignavibacteria bacterium]|nr:DUF4115 domain-containing protein [Ignavibacteria bacterium]